MKGFSATTIVIASILLMGTVTTSQFAFSDGANSPAACLSSNSNVFTDNSGASPSTHDAGAGNTIIAVCIKTGLGGQGGPSFANGFDHSNPIAPGPVIVGVDNTENTFGDGCYQVSAIPAQVVTVTDLNNDGCMTQSHIDFIVGSLVGGHGGITDNTALLVSGSHLIASWMLPVIVSAIGIGVFVFTRK